MESFVLITSVEDWGNKTFVPGSFKKCFDLPQDGTMGTSDQIFILFLICFSFTVALPSSPPNTC